ncbi:ArnT family glycosyltransferase [Lysobacter soli]|uniref:Glycosyltransferase family 39 protein n=1 Tax=Lysobacter soli TaxID=453783 RepID=A0A3D8VAK5_9GAMM|nr:glycosyltransferase family 39 protein [Lysobacter soli]RDY66470.1 glycosyltransferase family 39 protein [Lysobacter soli]
MRDAVQARRAFWVLWVSVLAVKLLIAARLPLFVDEAFYWQEGRHPAAAYSDLPGLTAWLTRLGTALGEGTFALRLPFLLIGAAVPLLMVHVASREFGAKTGWQAGVLTLLLPLAGALGLMALPDAAMALATLLCLDAGARLLRQVDAPAALELAFGLALGALCHYRFIAVIVVGFVALLMLPEGRRVLRDVRVVIAIAFGASAWAPLVAWNLDNADAGLRFQLVDRHPWSFHADGILFIGIQALLVTPLLFAAMAVAARRSLWCASTVSRYFALLGTGVVAGFFALGFFADTERVSFHWPLPGYLALLPLVPAVLATWPRAWRLATWWLAGAGLVANLGYYVAVSNANWREASAAEKWYPANFAGWETLADSVRAKLDTMPEGTRVVADNFKIGAELGFALGDARIPVLDHPINLKHGRAPQLRLWGLQTAGRSEWGAAPVLLVVGATEVKYRDLLDRYHALCGMVGPLPPPEVLNIDHGRQRFLLFALTGEPVAGPCTTPSMAWVDSPVADARVGRRFDVRGWAFKDGVGLSNVEVTLDGKVVGQASYGREFPGLQQVWPVSNDPQHPRVGFDASIQLGEDSGFAPGTHWLGLRLTGRDGSVETWAEQPVELTR